MTASIRMRRYGIRVVAEPSGDTSRERLEGLTDKVDIGEHIGPAADAQLEIRLRLTNGHAAGLQRLLSPAHLPWLWL